MTPDEKYKNFQVWLEFMPDAIAEWRELLPKELNEKLDFSRASLTVLEEWLLESFPDTKVAFSNDNVPITDGAARYVGETLRELFGGTWDMDVHDENSIAYGMPHMKDFPKAGPPVVPLQVVYQAIDRRDGDYFEFIAKHRA